MTIETVTVGDGKYTVQFDNETGSLTCNRNSEIWRDMTGDKMILCLMQRIQELEVIAKPSVTFEQAWVTYEAKGYMYGDDALSNVKFGYDIAHEFIGK